MVKGTYPMLRLDMALQLLVLSLDGDDLFDDIPELKSNIQTLKLDLNFLRMFSWMLSSYGDDSEYDWHFLSAINVMLPKLTQTIEEFFRDYVCVRGQKQGIIWEEMAHGLEKVIQQFKPQAKEMCFLVLDGSSICYSRKHQLKWLLQEQGREITSVVDFILQNLNALLESDVSLIAPLKQQICFIQQKLKEFPGFSKPVNLSIIRVKKLSELVSRTQVWLQQISCLVCLYWIKSPSSTTEAIVSGLIKLSPCAPGFVASHVEDTMISQLLASYFDSVLKDLDMKDDDIEVLRGGLIFLSSFVTNPPMKDSEDVELILPRMYAIINELPSLISKTDSLAFLQKINACKAMIRKVYGTAPYSAELNPPRTNPIGFLDSLLRTLKKMLETNLNFIPSMKHQIDVLHEVLVLLRRFLEDYTGMQDGNGKFKDLWTRAIVLVYHAAHVSHISAAKSFPVWYSVGGLPDVIEDIKLINNEFQRLEYQEKNKEKMLDAGMVDGAGSPPEAITPKIEGTFVGFQEDAKSIIDYLVGGRKDLTIISISGMPGQGKTTLAKKVYNDPQTQYHFHKTAWCYVSRKCTAVQLLTEIGCVLIGPNTSGLELPDLVEWLRKSLKERRYLLVMDDVWDVELWHQVQGSFPNDSNGSRILFTSRNHDLASGVGLHCISHRLRLFSEEESQELMKEKLFPGDSRVHLEFLYISRQIASYCKGLPLAVALISSTLQRTERKLDLWEKVAENLKSHLVNEGCGNVIELSYKYLPHHLRSCFLYFAAFPRGRNIYASELKQLWIAEGFIKDDEKHCSEYLASKYLDNLVSQNLVVVVERSSMGGVKKCNVHDLLYDLCLEKAKEENFLNWSEEIPSGDGCCFSPRKCGEHRLCIRRADPFIRPRSLCMRNELPTTQLHSYFWFHDHISNFWFPESCPVLKVLDLEQVYLDHREFPQLILSNIHLKYLALNFGYLNIDCIPPTIANLWNLETLVVVAKMLNGPLPDCMWKMKSLRRVKLCRARLCLQELGENNFFVLNNIGSLGELELGSYDIKTAEFLRKLPNLRKLHCHIEDKTCYHIWLSMIGSLPGLQSLFIDGNFYEPSLYVTSPLLNLPSNLRKLSLWGVYLAWSAISVIAKGSPVLQVLKLSYGACAGSRWKLNDGDFPSLMYLKLEFLDIEEIDVSGCEDNPFPCLEQLVVKNCYNLKEIPTIFEEMYTLKTIQMICSSGEANNSVRDILENQRDMGNNVLQVFVKENSNADTYRSLSVDDNSYDSPDWRNQLIDGSRQRIVDRMLETLCRHLHFSRLGDLKELKKRAMTYEDRSYAIAKSQSDYFRMISFKMFTMENRGLNTIASSFTV